MKKEVKGSTENLPTPSKMAGNSSSSTASNVKGRREERILQNEQELLRQRQEKRWRNMTQQVTSTVKQVTNAKALKTDQFSEFAQCLSKNVPDYLISRNGGTLMKLPKTTNNVAYLNLHQRDELSHCHTRNEQEALSEEIANNNTANSIFVVHRGRKIVRKKKRKCIKCHECIKKDHNKFAVEDIEPSKFQRTSSLQSFSKADVASGRHSSCERTSSMSRKPPPTPPSRRPIPRSGSDFRHENGKQRHHQNHQHHHHQQQQQQQQQQYQYQNGKKEGPELPVLALQSSNAVSLPANIDNLSDEDEDDEEDEDLDEDLGSEHIHNHLGHFAHDSTSHPKLNGRSSLQGGHERASNPTTPVRRGNKLKRRKAYYTRQRSDITTNPVGPTWSLPLDAFFDAQYQFSLAKGRSKSLTSIDALNPMSNMSMDADCRSETELAGERLTVPLRCDSAGGGLSHQGSGYQRRRKLSTTGKVSSSEFLTVSFECFDGERGPEEFMPATRGTCLREAIATVCERRGIDVDSINVYLDNSTTPLPLLTTETAWLGGKVINIRAKDDSKSPIRASERISVTAPPSRKASAVSNSGRSKSRLFNSASSSEETASLLSSSFGGLGSSNPQQSLSALNISASFDTNTLRVSSTTNASTSLAPNSGQSAGSAVANKAAKTANRWSGLWGGSSKESKMGALVSQLDNYSKIGIPKLHHQASFAFEDEVEEALYSLEEDWSDIVRHSNGLSERVRSQQAAIWELVETEVAYIRTLKVIQDLFLNCLCNLQNNSILSEIDTERLFCNIPEIYTANRIFWHENINPMVKASRISGEPLDPNMMVDGFLKFEEIFSPYSRYCSDQTNCQEYCRDQDRNNEIFKAYLAWCETQKDCNRLRLLDILVRPMQRLTKYSLLLKAILKKTDEEHQRNNLILMDEKVDAFVSDVNSHLRQRQEHERLKTIAARIEAYEPVETKDEDLERLVQSHCRLDLATPMIGCTENQKRFILYEGDLKLREGLASKMDIHAFLFSDMLLICKNLNKKSAEGGKVKVIRQPYIIDRLLCTDISKEGQNAAGLAFVYLSELNVVAAAFTLHSSENKVIKCWKEQIQKAKDLYEEAKVASMDRFYLSYCDEEEELSAPSAAHSGLRRGSYRGSKLSSIGHSYSGSVDMNEFLTIGGNSSPQLAVQHRDQSGAHQSVRRNRSFELQSQHNLGVVPSPNPNTPTSTSNQCTLSTSLDHRASSLSSEEGQPLRVPGVDSHGSSTPSPNKSGASPQALQGSYPASPRRHTLVKGMSGGTPNTLTVQIPYQSAQSLPTSPSSAPSPGPSIPEDKAPPPPSSPMEGLEKVGIALSGPPGKRCKSPTARGISYPPISPKSLKRGVAIHPSQSIKNPPLIKSRHVVSAASIMDGHHQNTTTSAHNVPVIKGIPPIEVEPSEGDESEANDNPGQVVKTQGGVRGGRGDRSTDTRRYHTAGAIEDIKKQDVRDHTIQKRLSWNYGQHIPNNDLQLKNKNVGKCLSTDSMQSSSGVSSTGSLHLSIGSEIEEHQSKTSAKDGKDEVDVSQKHSPAVSLHVNAPTTPSKSLSSRPFPTSTSNHGRPFAVKPTPPPVPPRANINSSQHVSTTYITQDDVVVTSSPKVVPKQGQKPPNSGAQSVPQVQISVTSVTGGMGNNTKEDGKSDVLSIRELLLSDNSVESSNV
ncbi:pleckstrin homology domain-containing family G member 5-like isoform X3 [Tigriopus californicus]|uniref:pleckstrin homology domain-containing family G member 5-like isoform X3 n=1 Tax=Tigriopus californicus TaxID=6832 RepID=UPI0027DA43E9|nr:pleckstrin homology domain-containing family G member 5-like isoform X3 [Tigriopus californicus]